MPSGSNRAQIFLGALSIAAAASVGCNKVDPPTDPTQGIVAPYGAPVPPDAGAQAMAEAYGAPPPPPQDAAPPAPRDAGPSAVQDAAVRPPSPVGAYGAPPAPMKKP